MAWTEEENKKAGWVQKKLRLKAKDAAALASLASKLGLSQSDAVASLVRSASLTNLLDSLRAAPAGEPSAAPSPADSTSRRPSR